MNRLHFPLGYVAAFTLSIFFSPFIHAQESYWSPSRPVHLIAPGPPGAILDIVAIQLADKLTGSLGQTVIVENKPNAGGRLDSQSSVKHN